MAVRPPDPDPNRDRHDGRRWSALVALVLLVGAVVTVVTWRDESRSVEEADAAAARRGVQRLSAVVDTIEASLAGAAGVAREDGTLDEAAFEAYGLDLTSSSALEALALVLEVDAADREAFEARIRRPITDRGADGVLIAPDRPVHYPVLTVVPDSAAVRLIGFDIGGDPVRRAAAEAARDTGRTVFSPPVPSQPTGSLSFFVVQPVYRSGEPHDTVAARRESLLGFVSTAVAGEVLLDAVAGVLPGAVRVELRDDGVLLAGTEARPSGGGREEVEAAGRRWTLTVAGALTPDHTVAVLVGLVTLLLAGGLGYELRRADRHTRSLRRSSRLMARTAALAEGLAAARTVEEVAEAIAAELPDALGVRTTSVGLVDHEAGTIDVRFTAAAGPPAPRRRTIDLEAPLPLAAAARTGETVVVRTLAEWGAYSPPEVVAEVQAFGVMATICTPLEDSDGKVVATLGMAWAGEARIDDQVRSTVATVAEICAYALERARATDEAARRAEQLAQLAERLAGATTVEEVAEAVTTLGRRPVEAAAASVGIIDGPVLRVVHGDTVPEEYRRDRQDPSMEAPLAFTTAARTGTALLFEDQASYERAFPDAGGPAVGARAALPLRRPDGTTIGAIAHLWNVDRRFDDALRSTLRTIADLTGQAIERARLGALKAEAARHTEALAGLAQGLATSRSTDDVLRFLTEGVLEPLGAVHAAVGLIDGDELHRSYTPGVRTELITRLLPGTVRLDSPSPLAMAARSGEAVLVPDLEQARSSFPHLAEGWARLGFQALANLPLRDRRGAPLGALGLAWDHAVDLDGLRDRLATIAGIAGQTLDRAQLSDAEHRLVTTFQAGLLTPLPPHPGLETAERYLPAAQAVGMGGDWYEGVVLPDGRYVVVVGDVAGHGIPAVSQMAQLRSVIGAMAALELPVGEVFARTTVLPHQGEAVIASAALLQIDLTEGVLRYACAGHPPPVVRHPDGTVTVLDGGRQPLLGIPMSGCEAGVVAFPVGSVVVAYTDGLIERRREPIDESIQRLANALEGSPAVDPGELADDLLHRCLADEEPTDDVALAVVRRAA